MNFIATEWLQQVHYHTILQIRIPLPMVGGPGDDRVIYVDESLFRRRKVTHLPSMLFPALFLFKTVPFRTEPPRAVRRSEMGCGLGRATVLATQTYLLPGETQGRHNSSACHHQALPARLNDPHRWMARLCWPGNPGLSPVHTDVKTATNERMPNMTNDE